MTLGWFANALNSVSKVGQKIGSGISKIGEKTGKVIQAGEKVLNTGSNILHDPVGSLTNPGETLGSMSEAASGMVGSLGGLASTVNNVGSDIGGPLWDNSPLSTIGFLGEVGSEAGRTLDISSKVFSNMREINSHTPKLTTRTALEAAVAAVAAATAVAAFVGTVAAAPDTHERTHMQCQSNEID